MECRRFGSFEVAEEAAKAVLGLPSEAERGWLRNNLLPTADLPAVGTIALERSATVVVNMVLFKGGYKK